MTMQFVRLLPYATWYPLQVRDLTVVFVVLGRSRDYMRSNIALCRSYLGAKTEIVSISDEYDKRLDSYAIRQLNAREIWPTRDRRSLSLQLEQSGRNSRWRENYWTNVIGRFVVLSRFAGHQKGDVPLIHVENDVALFASSEILNGARGDSRALALGVDESNVCPGLLLTEDADTMREVCDFVVKSTLDGSASSDMAALSQLRSQGTISLFPSEAEPSDHSLQTYEGEALVDRRVIFDTIFLGQYLFGIDPRNERGVRIPGIRLQTGGHDAAALTNWSMQRCSDGLNRVCADSTHGPVVLANLHVHGKLALPSMDDAVEWSQVFRVANGQEVPKAEISWLPFLTARARSLGRRVVRG